MWEEQEGDVERRSRKEEQNAVSQPGNTNRAGLHGRLWHFPVCTSVYRKPTVKELHCTGASLYRSSTVQELHCTGDTLYRSSNVQELHCTGAPLYRSSTVQELHCTGAPLYTALKCACNISAFSWVAWITAKGCNLHCLV